MASLKVDTKGLRGGPIEWTKDNHFRTRQYYRVYTLGHGQGRDRAREGLDRVRREVRSRSQGSGDQVSGRIWT